MLKPIVSCFALAILAVAISGCSGGKLLSTLSVGGRSCVEKDRVFDKEHDLEADIYYSDSSGICGDETEANAAPATLVFVYGGSWKSGDKSEYSFVADAFTAHGYNVVLPNYRLFPRAAYPEFIEDLESFMLWLADNADELKLNTRDVFLMGHSAGAYNASMYLADSSYEKPFKFAAFIGLAGPYDYFLPSEDPEYIPVFSRNNRNFNEVSELPVNQNNTEVKKFLSRALLLHGADDKIVTPKNPASFGNFLTSHGVPTETKLYSDKGHISLVAGVSQVPFFSNEVKDDVLNFLAEVRPQAPR